MNTSIANTTIARPRAASVSVGAERLRVELTDGREISVPVAWFEWLAEASEEERKAFRLVGGGEGIWWDRLDDGISVPLLMGAPEWQPRPRLTRYVVEYRREGQRWMAEIPELESSTWARTLAAAKREAWAVMAMLLDVEDVEAAGIEVVDMVHARGAKPT